jgi:threonine dehydrogenase-like Zn-dependent dehydrogenase
MARTGKAAVFRGPGKPFELRELAIPELEAGAVLVRVSLANICGSDLHFWRGDAPLALPPDGWIFGHEMTGRVAALGAGVATDSLGQPLREGDRVAYPYFYPCGRCYVCLHGQRAACPHKVGRATGPSEFPHWVGAFAEYYYVRPGGFVFRVPDDLPDTLVSPVNCALSQVIFGLTRAGLTFGESVVVQGAGGLGIQAVAVAREMGAGTVIVVDQLAERLDLARAFGADHTLSLAEVPDRRARVKQVRDWTGGRGADLACDFVGFPSGRRALRCCATADATSRSAASAGGAPSSSTRRRSSGGRRPSSASSCTTRG